MQQDTDAIIALVEDNNDSYSHGERLHVYIKQLMQDHELSWQEISAIAVSAGPGSYTGLRIGVATAKGLAYAKNKPLIAVPTLASLASQAPVDRTVIACLDARRMEVYAGVFIDGNRVKDDQPHIWSVDSRSYLGENAERPLYWIGTGIKKASEIVDLQEEEYHTCLPSAAFMCALACSAFRENNFVDLAYFEPNYLKGLK
jgi:Inactive homolog of metal-dependent proteases, putative molecular chaperone